MLLSEEWQKVLDQNMKLLYGIICLSYKLVLYFHKKTELLSKQPNNLEHEDIQEPNFNLTSQFQLVI